MQALMVSLSPKHEVVHANKLVLCVQVIGLSAFLGCALPLSKTDRARVLLTVGLVHEDANMTLQPNRYGRIHDASQPDCVCASRDPWPIGVNPGPSQCH